MAFYSSHLVIHYRYTKCVCYYPGLGKSPPSLLPSLPPCMREDTTPCPCSCWAHLQNVYDVLIVSFRLPDQFMRPAMARTVSFPSHVSVLDSKPTLAQTTFTKTTWWCHSLWMMTSLCALLYSTLFLVTRKFDNKYRIGWVQSSLWIAHAHIIHSMRNYSILIYCYVCAGTHRIVPVTLNAYCTGGNIHHRIRMGLL